MIRNATRNCMLATKTIVLRSFFQKTRGLMFSAPTPDTGLVFWFSGLAIRGIHTFFVKTPIDVLYLDDSWRVVEMKLNLKPFDFYNPKRPSQFIIELPPKTLTSKNCRIGDQIVFVEADRRGKWVDGTNPNTDPLRNI